MGLTLESINNRLCYAISLYLLRHTEADTQYPFTTNRKLQEHHATLLRLRHRIENWIYFDFYFPIHSFENKPVALHKCYPMFGIMLCQLYGEKPPLLQALKLHINHFKCE